MPKKVMVTLVVLAMTFSLVACGNSNTQSSVPLESSGQESNSSQSAESSAPKTVETETGKTLVVYFSHSGNTRAVATSIQTSVGADIFEIKTTGEYPADYDDVLDIAQKEQSDNARPELKATANNMENYDTIFIGYPNWWGDMPMAVYTFLDTYDLSGKTVIPFCTSGGSGLSDTVNSIKAAEPNATILDGLAIRDSSANSSESEISEWIAELGL